MELVAYMLTVVMPMVINVGPHVSKGCVANIRIWGGHVHGLSCRGHREHTQPYSAQATQLGGAGLHIHEGWVAHIHLVLKQSNMNGPAYIYMGVINSVISVLYRSRSTTLVIFDVLRLCGILFGWYYICYLLLWANPGEEWSRNVEELLCSHILYICRAVHGKLIFRYVLLLKYLNIFITIYSISNCGKHYLSGGRHKKYIKLVSHNWTPLQYVVLF